MKPCKRCADLMTDAWATMHRGYCFACVLFILGVWEQQQKELKEYAERFPFD